MGVNRRQFSNFSLCPVTSQTNTQTHFRVMLQGNTLGLKIRSVLASPYLEKLLRDGTFLRGRNRVS